MSKRCPLSYLFTFKRGVNGIEIVILNDFSVFVIQGQQLKKVDTLELWSMSSAYCLLTLYICVVFHENISNGFHLTMHEKCDRRPGR